MTAFDRVLELLDSPRGGGGVVFLENALRLKFRAAPAGPLVGRLERRSVLIAC